MDNKQPNAKMQARAVFHRKDPCLETQECEIEKVITLSDVEFNQFQQMLLNDYDFLRDNAELMRVENGVTHCLLVVGTNSEDGILVNSEGSSYARYTAFFPRAKAFLQSQGQMLSQELIQAHETSKLRVMTQDDLNIMQAKHTLWVYDQGGEQANFSGCRLSGLDMSGMQLNGADFTGALLERVNMSSSGVCSCVFRDAWLIGCNMAGIYAEEADFSGAVFEECNLKRGIFTHSNFAHAQFHDTDLRMADMRRCCMEGAKITGTEEINLSDSSDNEESWENDFSQGMGGM